MSGENHFVTPTYQSLLILGLDTVAKRLADKQVWEAWEALKTLFVELPPECQLECKKEYDGTEKKLRAIFATRGYTIVQVTRYVQRTSYAYLAEANLKLFDVFKNSLFAKGYLESGPIKPRNPQPTALGEG